jgi:hypothetical protein
MSFEDIATWAADLPADTAVRVDPRHGHIRVHELILADLGSVLDVWPYGGCHLTPATAADLGRALLAWAEKRTALTAAAGGPDRVTEWARDAALTKAKETT